MLKPEQAKARLAEWQLPRGEDRIGEAIVQLPNRLSDLAAWAYCRPKVETQGSGGDWDDAGRRGREAIVELDNLSVNDRAQVFAVVSPALAPVMEGAWQLLKTMPYQTGHQSKAFRAPHHPHAHAGTMYRWMFRLAQAAAQYPGELLTHGWLAAWAPYLSYNYMSFEREIGILLAAVLNRRDAEAAEVFEILQQSLLGQHEIGAPGRHIYTAFLLSERREAWEIIEKTLLAAQRQEGLRQAILETIDFAHPQAFRRMLGLILEHDLYRFSSAVRAVDVWFGYLWSAASGGVIKKMLGQVVRFLDDTAVRAKAITRKDAEAAFLALWCEATEDAVASVPLAEELLRSKSVELRYVAARHLANLDLKEAWRALVPTLDDEDLRVALLAIPWQQYSMEWPGLATTESDNRFERLERLVDRLPNTPQKLKPLVWPWTEMTVKQQQVAPWLIAALGDRPATRLIPHLGKLDPRSRTAALDKIVSAKPWDDATRKAVVDLAGDASADVRYTALESLKNATLVADDLERLESYLTRKSGDLRSGVLAILLRQDDAGALASSKRLLAAKDANQRLAALELLRLMTDANRCVPDCRRLAAEYEAGRKKVSKDERAHLDEISAEKASAPTLDDALGFMDPKERTPVVPPRKLNVRFITPAAVACLKSLDELVDEHRETPIRIETYNGVQEQLLGNVEWGFPRPLFEKPRDGQEQKLPLADVWKGWFADRDDSLRDEDGLELVRAKVWLPFCDSWSADAWRTWANRSPQRKSIASMFSGGHEPSELHYPRLVGGLLDWLLFLNPADACDYLLDALETSFASVPADEMKRLSEPIKVGVRRRYFWGQVDGDDDWRDAEAIKMWSDALTRMAVVSGLDLTTDQQVRLWQLMHWRDEPFPGARRRRPDGDLLCTAYNQQAANVADVADHLLGPRGAGEYVAEGFDILQGISARKPDKKLKAWMGRHPEVNNLAQRAIARIVDLELGRGDLPTAATTPAQYLTSLTGIETLRRVLHALGKGGFKVGAYWFRSPEPDRRESLTNLAKITYPADDEAPEDFVSIMRAAVQEGQFPEERLLQLVFLAPQWLMCVEAYFGWEEMSEGVYWFLAHMRYIGGLGEAAAEAAGQQADEVGEASETDAQDTTDESGGAVSTPAQRKLSAWERLILERTPLSAAERDSGAIDVPWFQRTYKALGDKRWQRLAAAARFAANASQANRAKFLADVLLNRVSRKTLVDGIKKRQLKDHVRLLGLLPLAKGAKREGDLLERCRILREYRRYANQLSGLTKPSALRAWEIGMRNLAQTAGYPDPLRLEWAVGADAVKDLAKGPVVVQKEGVAVQLSLDESSKPIVTVRKGEKELKSIPPAIKKDKKVAELVARVADLKRQASGIRQSLEAAMCRGDSFTGAELREWCGHALLAPLLSRLIVIGEGILGYPDKQGKALRDHRGTLEPVKPGERLRLAHPHDLLQSQSWHQWQHECFAAERIQPFKQVFRELYVVTKQELKDGGVSHRYDGQQVQPRQALALFGQRGWNTQDGVFKVFHDLELTAGVFFDTGIGTPAEVEGAAIAGVSFTKRDQWKPIPLAEVPPRIFSEVMRDLDLVVSVAHAGGVDPEASASTIEMRESLLRETCALLKLDNVRFKANYALVDGELANYSVHLGSGSVHTLPGGALCIVPVHAQHRGRLFLPFADDDPRTAEVISKVLLLARDREIQDPAILEQIRR